MSTTLREAAEHGVHTITDLVGDAMQHIQVPHIDLARATHRRRSLSPAVVAVIAALVVLTVVAVRIAKGRTSAGGKSDAMSAAARVDKDAVAAA